MQTNQHAGGEQVQALGSVLYDLGNDLGLSAALGPKQAEKKLLFDSHWPAVQVGDVLVGDRAYADYSVMAAIVGHQCHFIIRLPRHSFTAVNTFWQRLATEAVVTLSVSSKARKYVADQHLATTLRVRLIKVVLPTGEVEVLGTDLLDARAYPAQEFGVVYGKRWQHEVCQSQPIKMTWGPLRLLITTIRLVVICEIRILDRNSRVRHRPLTRHHITSSYACAGGPRESDSVSPRHAHAPRRCARGQGQCSRLCAQG